MVERYPHNVTLQQIGGDIQDSNGNVISQPPTLELQVKARVKVAGLSQNTLLAENGDVVPFRHTISTPFFTQDFTNGIVVWQGQSFPIIRFRQYQNRCKIWI